MSRHLLVCGMLWSQLAVAAWGQPPAAPSSPSPREQVAQGFERGAPAIGATLPDIAAYDARGETLRLSTLRGKYTVLVFGCLT